MAYIEGFGDEVLLVLGIVFLVSCIMIAWATTSRTSALERRITEFAQLEWAQLRRAVVTVFMWLVALRRAAMSPANAQEDSFSGEQPAETVEEEEGEENIDDTVDDTVNEHESEQQTAGGETNSCLDDAPAEPCSSVTNKQTGGLKENVDNTESDSASGETSKEGDVKEAADQLTEGAASQEDNTEGSVEKKEEASTNTREEVSNNIREEVSNNIREEVSNNIREEVSSNAVTTEGLTPQKSTKSQGTPIKVRLRYLDETQRLIQTHPDETVGDFKRKNFATELAQNYIIRLIFNGQELKRDNVTLRSHNIRDDCVVHCLLSIQRTTDNNGANGNREQAGAPEFDFGWCMFFLFGLTLAIIWHFRFLYRHAFNTSTTLMLMALTFCYAVVVLSVLRRRMYQQQTQEHEHED